MGAGIQGNCRSARHTETRRSGRRRRRSGPRSRAALRAVGRALRTAEPDRDPGGPDAARAAPPRRPQPGPPRRAADGWWPEGRGGRGWGTIVRVTAHRPTSPRPSRTADGLDLVVDHYPGRGDNRPPVLLVHGLGSDSQHELGRRPAGSGRCEPAAAPSSLPICAGTAAAAIRTTRPPTRCRPWSATCGWSLPSRCRRVRRSRLLARRTAADDAGWRRGAAAPAGDRWLRRAAAAAGASTSTRSISPSRVARFRRTLNRPGWPGSQHRCRAAITVRSRRSSAGSRWIRPRPGRARRRRCRRWSRSVTVTSSTTRPGSGLRGCRTPRF